MAPPFLGSMIFMFLIRVVQISESVQKLATITLPSIWLFNLQGFYCS